MRAHASRWGCSFFSSSEPAVFPCGAAAREESVRLNREGARFSSEQGADSARFASKRGAALSERCLLSEGAGRGSAPRHSAVRMAEANAIRAPSARAAMTAPVPSRMGKTDRRRTQRPPRMNAATAAGRNRQRNAEKKSTLPMVEIKPSTLFWFSRG